MELPQIVDLLKALPEGSVLRPAVLAALSCISSTDSVEVGDFGEKGYVDRSHLIRIYTIRLKNLRSLGKTVLGLDETLRTLTNATDIRIRLVTVVTDKHAIILCFNKNQDLVGCHIGHKTN